MPSKYQIDFVFVSYTCKPEAGEAIAVRSAVAILGIKNPLLEAVISNAAEASGVVVPTPICAKALKLITAKAAVNIILLIVFIFFVLKVKVLVAEIEN